ncbi:MAG: molybdopterin biosynthesis protein [Desulfovibrionaceae bacterium]
MAAERNVYLTTIPIEEAVTRAREALDRDALVAEELVPASVVTGRVAARAVHARYSSPTFHSAAMDGIAVLAASTFAAREGKPLHLTLGEGYVPVNTGNPLPSGMDAVVMIEHVARVDETTVAIEAPAFPWQHVRRIGEDIVATELLFPRNHAYNAYDVGALLGGGIWDVPVWERIRVRIIPTGDEVLDYTLRPVPKPGQVVESNSQVLAALARQMGCVVERVAPVPDVADSIVAAVEDALASPAHVVIVCAGSSAGSKDFTRTVIERAGKVLVHGIAAMPGKPSLLGVARGKLVVGAPGYPVSAVVCFEELLAPLVAWLGRVDPPAREQVSVALTRKTPSKLGRVEFLRVSVGAVGETLVGTPLGRGAGNITTLSRAQAVVRIPSASEGLEAGPCTAELLAPRGALSRILVAVGSHDNTLDLLADELMGLDSPLRLASTHVGSMGGLTAVKNGTAHVAGVHLFDPETGDYNFPFLDKYLPGVEVVVVNLAIRHQGLIVARGNPLGIAGVHDLGSGRVRFINRQRGAGTRILLDYHLKQAGIAPDQVDGYDKEEFTHMAVAANVLTGVADAGLGIFAAARALDLDFVPLARERYDLVIPARFAADPKLVAMGELIATRAFQDRVRGQGGYETTLTGQVMLPGMGLGE